MPRPDRAPLHLPVGPPVGELQRWMQMMLMGAEGGHDAADRAEGVRAPVGAEETERTAELVVATSRLSSRQHLAIYQRSYLGRLREVMTRQFPTLAHALGGDLFRAFADDYLLAAPPASYTLGDLGARFASFLDETRPDRDADERESWPDFMIELARFEFALNVIFDEHAEPELRAAAIGDDDGELVLHSVLHLFEHAFPISRYYRDVSNGARPDLPFPDPEWCAVVRTGHRMEIVDLTGPQYELLRAVQAGAAPGAAADWPEWRAPWIEAGLFVRR